MERQSLLVADYLDIIFNGRNKKYGGYELRRSYVARTRKACAIVLLSAAVAAMIPFIASSLTPDRMVVMPPTNRPTVLLDIPVDPPKELPVHLPEPPSAVATIDNPVPKIVEDQAVTKPPVSVDELQGKVPALTVSPGLPGNNTLEPGKPDGHGQATVDFPVASKPTVHIVVEQMPSFDGDLAQYLRDHLRYPEAARQAGTEGRVGIRFVVNEDGSISQVAVTHQADIALDAEAVRVVSNMPRWKPGKQGGKAVKVYFTLPISFRLD